MRMRRVLTTFSARRKKKAAIVCLGVALLEIAFAGSVESRASRLSTRATNGGYPSQIYTGQPIVHDGQPYGLRSGGEGPLNASGSYGAMLEGRNPVGSTGF